MGSATCPSSVVDTTYRPLTSEDVLGVKDVLSVLPVLYPGGADWLDNRLMDALEGRARCTVADLDGEIAAVAIETPKAGNRLKLSTILVTPTFRGQGIGTRLAGQLAAGWEREKISEVYVTVAHTEHDRLSALLYPIGFTTVALEWDRYGTGRHEYILSALPTHGK